MAFKVSDFHDLVELLETHPQWRAQLRRLVLSKDVLALPRIVQELAAAHQRSEQRLTRLESVVQELAASVRELAAAQQRTEQRVEELAAAQKETRQELGRLSNRIGVTIEEEAGGVLRVILERKGYRAIHSDYSLTLNGEVDVVLPLHDAQGQPVWAVLEAKVRLSGRAVEAWAKRMRDPNFQAALREAGVAGPYLVYAYGMRIDESARDAAQQFGIGLLSSRGEEVPPTAPLST